MVGRTDNLSLNHACRELISKITTTSNKIIFDIAFAVRICLKLIVFVDPNIITVHCEYNLLRNYCVIIMLNLLFSLEHSICLSGLNKTQSSITCCVFLVGGFFNMGVIVERGRGNFTMGGVN